MLQVKRNALLFFFVFFNSLTLPIGWGGGACVDFEKCFCVFISSCFSFYHEMVQKSLFTNATFESDSEFKSFL